MRQMRIAILHFLVAGLALVGLLPVSHEATAQGSNGYDLSWWTVDGGNGALAVGGFALTSTVGQVDEGNGQGGGYNLSGGSWSASSPDMEGNYRIYQPIVVK